MIKNQSEGRQSAVPGSRIRKITVIVLVFAKRPFRRFRIPETSK